MGAWGRIVETVSRPFTAPLREQLTAERDTADLYREQRDELQESLRELVPDEIGWQKLLGGDVHEFAFDERRRVYALCRLMAIKSPLIKRGLALRYVYVHGRGVQIAAKATGAEGEQDVNAALQTFFDDPVNASVIGPQAAEVNERALGTDGNLFFALWTSPVAGTVRIRHLPVDEINDIITNPDDSAEVWFYHRTWQRDAFDAATGRRSIETREAYYPDVHYTPRVKPATIGGQPVVWDAPVVHLKVGAPRGWRFGVPDTFAACDWALAYKTFLEDWARLMRSLARFAWRTTAKGAGQAAAIRAKVAAAPSRDPVTGQANAAGATVTMPESATLEAIPKSGATLDSESGKPLATMVAAALDVPVTMLLGDPGVTGARATAETLDAPMTKTMEARRDAWTWLYTVVCNYVIDQAVRAPKGALTGRVTRNEYDREVVVLDGPGEGTDRSLDITWPDLTKVDPVLMVKAIVEADNTRTLPPLLIARMLLEVLGRRDIDEILEELTDDDGNFLWPESPPNALGQSAADAQRNGQDPAASGTGLMAPTDDQQTGDAPADANAGGKT